MLASLPPTPRICFLGGWLENDAPSGEAEARGWLWPPTLWLQPRPAALLEGNTPTGQTTRVLIHLGRASRSRGEAVSQGGLSLDTLPRPLPPVSG